MCTIFELDECSRAGYKVRDDEIINSDTTLDGIFDLTFLLGGSSYKCSENQCETDDVDKSIEFLMDIFNKRKSLKKRGITLPKNFVTCLEIGFKKLSKSIEIHQRQNVQMILSGLKILIYQLRRDRSKLIRWYSNIEIKTDESIEPSKEQNKDQLSEESDTLGQVHLDDQSEKKHMNSVPEKNSKKRLRESSQSDSELKKNRAKNSQSRNINKDLVHFKIGCYDRTYDDLQKIMKSDDVEYLIEYIENTWGMEPEYYTPLKYIDDYPNHPWWEYEREERRMEKEKDIVEIKLTEETNEV
ncbi:unnamed protein product [Caenorhabditis angaria]|uniref:Uncharacterized protein n=1 Tax=Caenorhabditis angaria TaxID=860376 RepID=A0A9P1IEE9_9PELO|nr:unnamed protein product [Caenorhabditis angaria]